MIKDNSKPHSNMKSNCCIRSIFLGIRGVAMKYSSLTLVAVLVCLSLFIHFFDRAFLNWQVVVLLCLFIVPLVLPIIAQYIESFGKDGFKTRSQSAVVTADSLKKQSSSESDTSIPALSGYETSEGASQSDSRIPNHTELRFSDLKIDSRKLLRTLWKYQGETEGLDSEKRWGFTDDSAEFENGKDELLERSLISVNDRGLAFLSNEGIAFCKRRDITNALSGGGSTWDDFRPIGS